MNAPPLPLRILANAVLGSGPERPSREGPHVPAPQMRAAANTRNVIETELARIIEEPAAPGESLQRAFDRKERELRALFLSLTRAESFALHAKLLAERDTADSLLARLTDQRRSRVLACLTEIVRGKAAGQ
jgi:hypothetical protein